MPFISTWMSLEIIILSEVNEKENKYHITYMWNLKYDTNLSTKQKQIHRHRKQTCGYQRGNQGRATFGIWD